MGDETSNKIKDKVDRVIEKADMKTKGCIKNYIGVEYEEYKWPIGWSAKDKCNKEK